MYLHYFERNGWGSSNIAVILPNNDEDEAWKKATKELDEGEAIDDYMYECHEVTPGMTIHGWGHDASGLNISSLSQER